MYNDSVGDVATKYRVQVSTSSSFSLIVWDTGTTTFASTTAQGQRSPDITYAGPELLITNTYYWRIKFLDNGGAESVWSSSSAAFTVNNNMQPPLPPTDLLIEAQVNPSQIGDVTPEFSAVYHDLNATNTATHYQIQISASSTFSSLVWNSGQQPLASSTLVGNRVPDITYFGNVLGSGITYYWRIKFWDSDAIEGEWSTTTATFAYAVALIEGVQKLTYEYDAVGNITQITDISGTVSAGTITYLYDDLYRLTSASSTLASSIPYKRTYTYNALGNILTSDQGTYTYSETNYANPHAVTGIAGVTYTYDQSGNLASTSAGISNTWNYRNELTQSQGAGTASTSYFYDVDNQRVKKVTASSTTFYISPLYEKTGATTTKYIYLGDSLLATIEGNGTGTSTYHNHLDHLGSTNVVTDQNGFLTQVLDYYPYGSLRVDESYGGTDVSKKFTGHELDHETDLTYAGARYLNSDIGKWISQDPASRDNPNQFLRDPQQFNMYSYARNNPLIFVDPNGEKVELVARPVISSHDAHMFYLVTPDNPSQVSINGVPQGTEKFSVGAYNRGGFIGVGNKLTPEFGYAGMENPNTDTPYLTGEKTPTASVVITPPNGMSDTDFINSLGASANGVEQTSYYMLGRTGKFGAANSNNFVNEVGTRAGVGGQVQSFSPSSVYIPGKNQGVPTATLLDNIKSTLNSIKERLSRKDNNE